MGPPRDDEAELEDDFPLAAGSDDEDLRDLEARLEKLKSPDAGGGNKTFARGVALATSMGFVLAGCIGSGAFAGNYFAQRWGNQAFSIIGICLGLAAAVLACVKLLKPFMQSED